RHRPPAAVVRVHPASGRRPLIGDAAAPPLAVRGMIRVDSEVPPDMPLLTVRAAAERMGIGYSTLKQWIHQGKIRTTKTAGGHHRLAESEIDRLLAPHTAPPRAGRRRASSGLIVALSGRNRLRGFVEEVRTDGLLGQVRLRIGDQVLTAV